MRNSTPERVTSAQLMIAILEEGQGVACQILTRRGVELAELTAAARASGAGC